MPGKFTPISRVLSALYLGPFLCTPGFYRALQLEFQPYSSNTCMLPLAWILNCKHKNGTPPRLKWGWGRGRNAASVAFQIPPPSRHLETSIPTGLLPCCSQSLPVLCPWLNDLAKALTRMLSFGADGLRRRKAERNSYNPHPPKKVYWQPGLVE